jgi:hypothetical protein
VIENVQDRWIFASGKLAVLLPQEEVVIELVSVDR